jgi:2-methylcitrate dehydratase PrpD
MTRTRNVSQLIAEHVSRVTYEDLPSNVVEITKLSILDGIGVILGASGLAPECRPFVDTSIGGKPESTLLGFGERTDAPGAAFANGAMSHALDFEDAHVVAPVHANAAALPAALALAEAEHLSGKALIVALALGCDLASRMGLAVGTAVAERGWYPPPILSTQAAVAATGSLLRLDTVALLDAMSIAACQIAPSFEIVNGERSVLRSVREGFCARAALTSGLLARAGVAGGPRPLDGTHGILPMFAGSDWNEEILLDQLGERYEGLNTSFKLWPSCRGTHAFVDGVVRLRQRAGFDVRQVERVTVRGGPVARMLIEPIERKRSPQTAIDAKFSIPFTVAAALADGGIGLDSFEPARLRDPDVLALAARVECTVVNTQPDNSAIVTVEERGGRRHTIEVKDVPGDPNRPLAGRELRCKFADCAARAAVGLGDETVADLIEAIDSLESIGDIAELTSPLVGSAGASTHIHGSGT